MAGKLSDAGASKILGEMLNASYNSYRNDPYAAVTSDPKDLELALAIVMANVMGGAYTITSEDLARVRSFQRKGELLISVNFDPARDATTIRVHPAVASILSSRSASGPVGGIFPSVSTNANPVRYDVTKFGDIEFKKVTVESLKEQEKEVAYPPVKKRKRSKAAERLHQRRDAANQPGVRRRDSEAG